MDHFAPWRWLLLALGQADFAVSVANIAIL